MKYTCVIFALLVAVVNCQSRGPPPPPPSAQGTSDLKSSPIVKVPGPSGQPQTQPAQPSNRPAGCTPGCYAEEICAELGRSYCRQGGQCFVCIKMSSIRFPASALSGMFSSPMVPQQPAVQTPPLQTGQTGQNPFGYMQPPANTFNAFQTQQSSNPFSYDPQPPPMSSLYSYFNQRPAQNQYSPPPAASSSSSNWSSSSMFPFLFFGDMGFGF